MHVYLIPPFFSVLLHTVQLSKHRNVWEVVWRADRHHQEDLKQLSWKLSVQCSSAHASKEDFRRKHSFHQTREGNQQHEQSPTKAGKHSFTQGCHQQPCKALGGSPYVYCSLPHTRRRSLVERNWGGRLYWVLLRSWGNWVQRERTFPSPLPLLQYQNTETVPSTLLGRMYWKRNKNPS